MVSEVDICNLALSHVGDDATVASINPPEGSTQASHCARFYPIARDFLLDSHNWGFCTTRATLNLLTVTPVSGWLYAYAKPSNVLKMLAVFSDISTPNFTPPPFVPDSYPYAQPVTYSMPNDYAPQEFESEILADGTQVIYSNTPSAIARYTQRITDPQMFSPIFTDTLGWLLASYLAGPVIKGEAGQSMAKFCAAMAKAQLSLAMTEDANQRRIVPNQVVPWIVHR